MNNKFKRALALFAAGCLCISTGYLAVSAANADRYNGRSKEHVYLQNGVDAFLNTENFFGSYAYNQLVDEDEIYVPGDSISGTAEVSNENSKTVNIYLYADASALDKYAAYNAKNSTGKTDSALKTLSEKLIDQITLTVSYKNPSGTTKQIYSGKMSGKSGMLTPISLGEYKQGDSGTLTFQLKIPETLGNEYSGAVGMIDWVFTCTQIQEPPEPEPPAPGTGEDAIPLAIGAAACAISALSIIIVVFRSKKKDEENA